MCHMEKWVYGIYGKFYVGHFNYLLEFMVKYSCIVVGMAQIKFTIYVYTYIFFSIPTSTTAPQC